MVYINEVRERLHRACIAGMDAEYVDDVIALLDDHARLRDIDLEQFRDAVESWKFHAETDMIGGYRTPNPEFVDDAKDRHLEACHLIALIDGQAATGCGACGDGCVTRGSCRVHDESPPCKIE